MAIRLCRSLILSLFVVSSCLVPFMPAYAQNGGGGGGGGGGGSDGSALSGSSSTFTYFDTVPVDSLETFLDLNKELGIDVVEWSVVWQDEYDMKVRLVCRFGPSELTYKPTMPPGFEDEEDTDIEKDDEKKSDEDEMDTKKAADEETVDSDDADTTEIDTADADVADTEAEVASNEADTPETVDLTSMDMIDQSYDYATQQQDQIAGQSTQLRDLDEFSQTRYTPLSDTVEASLVNLPDEWSRGVLRERMRSDPVPWTENRIRSAVQDMNQMDFNNQMSWGNINQDIENTLGYVDSAGQWSQFALGFVPGVGWGIGTALDVARAGADGYRDGKSLGDTMFNMTVEGGTGLALGRMGGGKAWSNAIGKTAKEIGTQGAVNLGSMATKSAWKNMWQSPPLSKSVMN
ncbi:hypothetical protein [uncultured Pseudodesulfovibrio sp.]|uniref:hypothetical protein n=1 Tax=uncultured Pseudodesulfovibrio sp. TaxID=2035858 RepID=UPI0029C91432|nr:hypothetical protein [uncultured Pseudodesulfovibrio sp.]